MKQNVFVFNLTTLFIIIISLSSCSTTDPIDDLKPGRRDYTWAIDTLKPPEGRSLPSRMWGANASDLWAVGLSYLNAYCIWHYDGQRWTNNTPDHYIDPRGIWGTSSNNIWIGSTDGTFWHYNGVKWDKFSETTIPNYQQFVVQSMCGTSSNEIYAVGFADSIGGSTYKAIIMRFNGTKWELVNIPTIKNSLNKILYDKKANMFLISSWIFDKPDQIIYSFDGTSLKNVFSTQDGSSIYNIGDLVYLVVKNKIYKFHNNTFEPLIEFSQSNYAGAAFGRTEKDFFTINWDGIGHYNGTDLITVYPKWNNDWAPGGGIIFEKDVYFIWDDSYNTFIVHGKLN